MSRTPWHAARNNKTKLLLELIEAGVSINQDNSWHETPLHLAAIEGHEDATRVLLDGGAAVDPQDRDLRTPLHHAAEKNFVNVCSLLMERGADPVKKDRAGITPTDIANKHGFRIIAAMLATSSEPVPCSLMCGAIVMRRLMAAHTSRSCPQRVEPCRLFCGNEVVVAKQFQHERDTCIEAEIDCPEGCGARIRRRDVKIHRDLTCPKYSKTLCRFGCATTRVERTQHELDHLRTKAIEWTTFEWVYWADLCLRGRTLGVGEADRKGDDEVKEGEVLASSWAQPGWEASHEPSEIEGTGPGAFVGLGIRAKPDTVDAATADSFTYHMKEAHISGRQLAQMTAHPQGYYAVDYLMRRAGVSAEHRPLLVREWINRCKVDGSTEAAKESLIMPIAIGTAATFEIVGEVVVKEDVNVEDSRKLVALAAARDKKLWRNLDRKCPHGFDFISLQRNGPLEEHFEVRYNMRLIGYILLLGPRPEPKAEVVEEVKEVDEPMGTGPGADTWGMKKRSRNKSKAK